MVEWLKSLGYSAESRRKDDLKNPAVNGTFFELGKDKAAKGEGWLRFLSAVPKRLWDSDADS